MLDVKNYTVRVGWSLIYWTRHPNSNPYHIIYAIFQVMSKLDLFSFYTHKNWKQRVSVNVYRFSFRSYADLTQMLAFFSRFIRLSVPMFNDIIVLGCIMCLSTIYLFGIRKVNDADRTMPRICKVRSNDNFMWLSTNQAQNRPLPPGGGGQGGEKDFIILSGFSLCNSFTGHCSYIHCFVGAFEKPVKRGLSGMNSFLKWTNLRKIAFGGLIKIFWLY